jgi:hypothetical protein
LSPWPLINTSECDFGTNGANQGPGPQGHLIDKGTPIGGQSRETVSLNVEWYNTQVRGRRPADRPVDRINEELREMYIRETEHK